MYAYGGAWAVHCPAVARQLGIKQLLIPMGDLASGWSAFGIASSDALVVQEAPVVMHAPFDPVRMNEVWEEMHTSILRRLEHQDLADSKLVWTRGVDIRYSLQVNEVPVNAPLGVYDQAVADNLVTAFEREYERIFGVGSGHAGAGFTLTGVRISARAKVSGVEPGQQTSLSTGSARSAEPIATRNVIWYPKGLEAIPTPVYDGARLEPHHTLDGPAIVEFTGTTLALGPEQSASLDAQGSIVVDT